MNNDTLLWIRRAAAIALVTVVFRGPHDLGEGFKLLRWIVAISAVWQIWEIRPCTETHIRFWKVLLGVIAIIFNPIQPFEFKREIWIFIDCASAIVLGFPQLYLCFRWIRKQYPKSEKVASAIGIIIAMIFFIGQIISLCISFPEFGTAIAIIIVVIGVITSSLSFARKLGGPCIFQKDDLKPDPKKERTNPW